MSTYTLLLGGTTLAGFALAGIMTIRSQYHALRNQIAGLQIKALEHDVETAHAAVMEGHAEVQRQLEEITRLENGLNTLSQQIEQERAGLAAEAASLGQAGVVFDNGAYGMMAIEAVEPMTVVGILSTAFGRDAAREVVKALFSRNVSFHRQIMLAPEQVLTEAELAVPLTGDPSGEAA